VLAIGGVVLLAAIGIPVIIFAFEVKESLTPEITQTFVGVLMALVMFVVITGCLIGLIAAYSKLRRSEEAEDDQREMDLLRVVNQMQAGKVTVHAGSGSPPPGAPPQGWEGLAPGALPPARPPAISYHDAPVDLS